MTKPVRDVATQSGWEVAGEAADGAEAVSLYQQFRPDLVTRVVVMPEMTGLQAVRAIRALAPGARVVMITALDLKRTVLDAIEAGAIDVIDKPFDCGRIAGLLAKLGGEP